MPVDIAIANIPEERTREAVMCLRAEIAENQRTTSENIATISTKMAERAIANLEDRKHFEQWRESIFRIITEIKDEFLRHEKADREFQVGILMDIKDQRKAADDEFTIYKKFWYEKFEKHVETVGARFNKWQNVLLGILWSWCGFLALTVIGLIIYIWQHGVK